MTKYRKEIEVAEWAPRQDRPSTLTPGSKRRWFYPQFQLREGERLLEVVRPSQVTNIWLHLAVITTAGFALAGLWNLALVGALAALYTYMLRAFPFYCITDERVVVVSINLAIAGPDETSIDHRAVTSAKLHDPLFGSLLGIQRIELYVAEGSTPKVTLRWLHNARQLHRLIGRRQ